MNKEMADRIVGEIKTQFPHVDTYTTSNSAHCAIGVFQHGTSILGGIIIDSEYEWQKVQKILSILAPVPPQGFAFSTYEELQASHLCPYCRTKGARFPEEDAAFVDGGRPDDLLIFVCERAHSFLVERKYVVEEKAVEDVGFSDLTEWANSVNPFEVDMAQWVENFSKSFE